MYNISTSPTKQCPNQQSYLGAHKKEVDKVVHSWNDLRDRPFGESETEVNMLDAYILDEEVVSSFGTYVYLLPVSYFPVDDRDLCVIFDGIEYKLPCKHYYTSAAWGNIYLIEKAEGAPEDKLNAAENSGEHFAVNVLSANRLRIIVDNSESHTVSISQSVSEITPLDSKYIPKAAAVADAAGNAPTAEEFNALLASLRAGGFISN